MNELPGMDLSLRQKEWLSEAERLNAEHEARGGMFRIATGRRLVVENVFGILGDTKGRWIVDVQADTVTIQHCTILPEEWGPPIMRWRSRYLYAWYFAPFRAAVRFNRWLRSELAKEQL